MESAAIVAVETLARRSGGRLMAAAQRVQVAAELAILYRSVSSVEVFSLWDEDSRVTASLGLAGHRGLAVVALMEAIKNNGTAAAYIDHPSFRVFGYTLFQSSAHPVEEGFGGSSGLGGCHEIMLEPSSGRVEGPAWDEPLSRGIQVSDYNVEGRLFSGRKRHYLAYAMSGEVAWFGVSNNVRVGCSDDDPPLSSWHTVRPLSVYSVVGRTPTYREQAEKIVRAIAAEQVATVLPRARAKINRAMNVYGMGDGVSRVWLRRTSNRGWQASDREYLPSSAEGDLLSVMIEGRWHGTRGVLAFLGIQMSKNLGTGCVVSTTRSSRLMAEALGETTLPGLKGRHVMALVRPSRPAILDSATDQSLFVPGLNVIINTPTWNATASDVNNRVPDTAMELVCEAGAMERIRGYVAIARNFHTGGQSSGTRSARRLLQEDVWQVVNIGSEKSAAAVDPSSGRRVFRKLSCVTSEKTRPWVIVGLLAALGFPVDKESTHACLHKAVLNRSRGGWPLILYDTAVSSEGLRFLRHGYVRDGSSLSLALGQSTRLKVTRSDGQNPEWSCNRLIGHTLHVHCRECFSMYSRDGWTGSPVAGYVPPLGMLNR